MRLAQISQILLACLVCFFASSALSEPRCRQALALGLDVSGSVNSREYQMQLDGLARALMHEEVQTALLSMSGAPVDLAVFEWSSPVDQSLVSDWTTIRSIDDLQTLAAKVAAAKRAPAEQSTGLGQAMIFGAGLLQQRKHCWKRTLDISGDGKSNVGPNPRDVTAAKLGDVTINALVIGADALDHGDDRQVQINALSSYFNAYVLRGPDSFVEIALGFEDYERAMVRKLKRELESFALTQN